MKKRKKKKIDYLTITLSIIAIIMTIYNIKQYVELHFVGTHEGKSDEKFEVSIAEENNVTQEMIEKDREAAKLSKIEGMNERDRMEYYYGIFLNHVEMKNYEAAYDLLYDGFKERYFPTIETFKKYMELRYNSNMTVTYTNIERNGDLYILWATVADLSKKQNFADDIVGYDTFSINVVIQEYDFNDYKLSFSIL